MFEIEYDPDPDQRCVGHVTECLGMVMYKFYTEFFLDFYTIIYIGYEYETYRIIVVFP